MKNKRFAIQDEDIYVLIYFCQEGEINSENPMFKIFTTKDGHEHTTYSAAHRKYIGMASQYDKVFRSFETFDDFRNEAKTFFGWE